MSAQKLVGVRFRRHDPLVLAACSSHITLSVGDVVLVETSQGSLVGRVDLLQDQILFIPESVPTFRIVAAGLTSPEVVAALRRDNAAALARVRDLCGEDVPICDASWSLDRARLTLTFAGDPPPGLAELRDRLASAFNVEIRFEWPGGSEAPLPA